MSRLPRVLLVEDEAPWRHLLGGILERGPFQVVMAASRDEVLEKLGAGFYHVALLDIQLDEHDPDNQDGLDLLASWQESKLLDAMAVVVTSVHHETEYVRHAFRQQSVDYLFKDELGDGEILLAKVREVLSDVVHFNGELKILWQSDGASDAAVVGLWIQDKRVRRGSAEAERVCEELEDLLCRLFPTSSSLVVDVMRPGLSGSGVLWARSFTDFGPAEPVVVKFGDARAIRTEYEHYTQFVEGFVGGNRTTTARRKAFTPNLGGIIFSFVGAEGERLEDFGDFYRRSDGSAIADVLRRLFSVTCARWYGNRGPIEPRDLRADYQELLGFTPQGLERALADKLKPVQAGPRVHFTNLSADLTFRNPIPLLAGRFLRSTATSITHGDFNQHNILLDAGGDAWLIDFMRTGRGHILRDVAQLDAVVRFQLLGPDEATLDERYEMERVLATTSRTDQITELTGNFGTANPALRKAFETSVQLRKIAARLIEGGGLADFSEYQVASLFLAVNLIRFYAVPQVQREHAFLAACVLAERLGP